MIERWFAKNADRERSPCFPWKLGKPYQFLAPAEQSVISWIPKLGHMPLHPKCNISPKTRTLPHKCSVDAMETATYWLLMRIFASGFQIIALWYTDGCWSSWNDWGNYSSFRMQSITTSKFGVGDFHPIFAVAVALWRCVFLWATTKYTSNRLDWVADRRDVRRILLCSNVLYLLSISGICKEHHNPHSWRLRNWRHYAMIVLCWAAMRMLEISREWHCLKLKWSL